MYFGFKNKTISNVQSLQWKILIERRASGQESNPGWNCKIVSYSCKISERSKGIYHRPFQTDNKPPKDLKKMSWRSSPLNNETFKNPRNIFPEQPHKKPKVEKSLCQTHLSGWLLSGGIHSKFIESLQVSKWILSEITARDSESTKWKETFGLPRFYRKESGWAGSSITTWATSQRKEKIILRKENKAGGISNYNLKKL